MSFGIALTSLRVTSDSAAALYVHKYTNIDLHIYIYMYIYAYIYTLTLQHVFASARGPDFLGTPSSRQILEFWNWVSQKNLEF